MPVTIKTAGIKYKNPATGDYIGVDTLTAATADQIAVVQAAGTPLIEEAKKWATGEKLNGDPVASTDEQYENNAYYYSQQAAGSATDAEQYAEDAKDAVQTYGSDILASFPTETLENQEVATIEDGAKNAPVADLIAWINCVQSGSGDPTPSNRRPISGYTGVTVYRSDEDTENPDEYEISWGSIAGTVYKGHLNVTTGVLTVTMAKINLGDKTWTYYSGANSRMVTTVSDIKRAKNNSTLANILCSEYTPITYGNLWAHSKDKSIAVHSTADQVVIYDTGYTDATVFKTALGQANAQLVYELKTPVTYQITPVTVKQLLGINNIWADIGNVSVTYRRDNKLTTQYVTPLHFGAAGDGITDDSRALIECAEYCKANNVTMYIPQNVNLKIPSSTTISEVRRIISFGTITAPNGITFVGKSDVTGFDWYFSKVTGELTLSGLKDSFVTILYAQSLVLYADGSQSNISSMAYNLFKFGQVSSLAISSINSGWINENVFMGGRITALSVSAWFNNNLFIHNSFEGATINVSAGYDNNFVNERCEGIVSVTFGAFARNNRFQNSFVGLGARQEINTAPSWWHDTYGKNYYGLVNIDYAVHELKYDLNSFNYNVEKLYPKDRKMHNASYNYKFCETNVFSIEHVVDAQIKTDETFWRMKIYLYDENGDQITTEPEYYPFTGNPLTWSNDNECYSIYSANQSSLTLNIARYTDDGEDSGAYYAKIVIDGYGEADFDLFDFTLSVPNYIHISPFEGKRLTSDSLPTSGDWGNGIFVYNTGNSQCMGWSYYGGAWHAITGSGG